MPTRDPTPAPSWSADYYALIDEPGSGRYGDRLAVCVAHEGEHVRYICASGESWCQALEPHDPKRRPSCLRQSTEPPPLRVVIELDTEAIGEAIGSGIVLGWRRKGAEDHGEPSAQQAPTPAPRAAARRIIDLEDDTP